MSVVRVETTGRVCTVTLHRPEARNALNTALLRASAAALEEAENDDDVDVVVLTGADPAFCAGLDLKELADGGANLVGAHEEGARWSNPIQAVWEMTKPVVGAINGACITGGFELALGCDFLVASDRAFFGDTHARVGVTPGGGMSVFLAMAVGLRKAKEMTFTGNFVEASEAHRLGLVNHVVPHDELMSVAQRLASDIAENDGPTVRHLKRLYDHNARLTVEDAIAHEREVFRTYQVDFAAIERRRRSVVERGRSQRGRPRAPAGPPEACGACAAGPLGATVGAPAGARLIGPMLFPTITFALFFMIVLPVSWLLMPRRRRWKLFMIGASYFFYGYWDWRFCFLLAGSTLANQLFARAIHATEDERTRRRWLAAAVVANLLVLGFFKYYDFFATSATNTLHGIGLDISPELVAVALPIGISFFTFQALSYVIDVYRRTFEPGRLLDFAVFLSFFPHVVAGPIVRPAEFMPQIKARHDPRRVDASRAFFLIFIGLFKKVVIANLLATEIVDPVFGSPLQHSSLEVLVGVYAYAVQIYADFSGYTDMAIGLALLLGFRFPQNFDSPYTSTSIQDFWRRWHMTLSRWLRDYLYVPLGGNRRGRRRTYLNLMLTMVLGGLWHGAAWTFVVWGAIHGVFLSIEHWRRGRRLRLALPEPVDTAARRWTQRIVTFNMVCFAWVFFRSESLANALELLGRLVDPSHWFDTSPLITAGVLLAIAAGLVEQYIPRAAWGRAMARFSYLSPAVQGLVLGVVLLFTNTMGPSGVAPFIYFRF